MRTRIKIVELNSGQKVYIPQSQGIGRLPKFIWKLIYKYAPDFFWIGYEEYDTIENAKQSLDIIIEKERRANALLVKEVKYVKYPM
jgi:hypothetical protein